VIVHHASVGSTSLTTLTLSGELVFATYVTITIIASVFTGIAAVTYLIGHEYPKAQADMKRIPRSWVLRLGVLLAAGSLGLLAGFAVPLLGALAAAGLVLYFLGALIAHLRVGSRQLVGWAVFFSIAVAALAVNLAHHL
jgi:DoxX-like family